MHGTRLPFPLKPLEAHLVIPKPIEEAPQAVLEEIGARDDLVIERKRNGYGMLAAITEGKPRHIGLYTRGIEEHGEKFPDILEELRSMNIPKDTLLMGEGLATDRAGNDRPGTFTSIIKSKAERAIALGREHPVGFALYNVLIHKGRDVAHLPYGDRLDIVRELTAKHRGPQVSAVEVLDLSLAAAQGLARQRSWEGLVLYDRRAGTEYRVGRRMQTPRPPGCWKWKEYNEGDFVATGYVPSTARSHPGAVKDFLLAQYDQHGTLHEWGKCGIGISEAERREYADPSLYPMVFEIKFERRTPNRRLILAQILRRREDKAPYECVESIGWDARL